MNIKYIVLFLLCLICTQILSAQVIDSSKKNLDSLFFSTDPDSSLRITNLNPYITLHVDSTLNYKLDINKTEINYYWFLKNAPVGLKINKDNGLLTFKAEKNFFLSGKLRYDYEYKVSIGVQNLHIPKERVDTVFTLVFYNTEIIPSKVKPSVNSILYVEEGDTISFQIQCENGSFPIEHINFFSAYPLKNYSKVKACDDIFTWSPSFDFVKDTDSAKMKIVTLNFVGSTRFMVRDTATVKVFVKDALNYPLAVLEHKLVTKNINNYLLQLKYLFQQLDKTIKSNKNTRTTFDLTSATTALTGTILATSSNDNNKNAGKVLPTVGVTLVPVKEAVAPAKLYEQSQATSIRTAIKRLDFLVKDNELVGDKDADIQKKTNKLKEELKQVQIQLVDVPLELISNLSEEELNAYFNSPKVSKKYRLNKKK